MWALENNTPFEAERACLVDARGARVWVVVVRGTFEVGPEGQAELADEQLPVLREPVYAGEPGQSELLHDADLVVTRPTTDLLVLGRAHAPVGHDEGPVPLALTVSRGDQQLLHKTTHAKAGEPAGMGPVAPYVSPRLELAGTYDEAWRTSRAPLLPEDFDERFYLCSPEDQRPKSCLEGGDQLLLENLSPEGTLRLELPRCVLTFSTSFSDGQPQNHLARLFSVTVEPEHARLQLVWQTHLACHDRIYKLQKTVVRMLQDVDLSVGEDGQLDLLGAQPTLPWMGREES